MWPNPPSNRDHVCGWKLVIKTSPLVLAAVWRGSRYLVGQNRWKDLARAAFNLVKALADRGILLSLYTRRDAHCSSCPLYNAKDMTCGTAGQTWTDPRTFQREPYGCWCVMPMKAGFKTNCWLYDVTGGELGWPKELNSYP